MEFFQFIAGFRQLMTTTHLNIRCKLKKVELVGKIYQMIHDES